MASRKDYYDILGVRRGATEEEIEKAYRRLTRTYQLDRPPGNRTAESRFREISEAYEILSNKEKRERYDRSGGELPFPDIGWEYDPEEGEEEDFGLEGFEDVFERGIGRGQQAPFRKPQKGKGLFFSLELKFEEAVRGTVKEILAEREISCPECAGKGVDPASPQKVCDECGGAGQVQIGLPPTAFSYICPRCRGGGRVHLQLCGSCSGKGQRTQKEVVFIEIPPGVDDGCRIYLTGMGQVGNSGGPTGDLGVTIRVQEHPYFLRRGDDLHLTVPLAVWEAALGAEVEVPTLDGPVTLAIPQGTQSRDRLRLAGKGVPHFHGGGRGDQVISLEIVLPQGLNDRSKDVLGELKRLNPEDPRQGCGWRLHP
jgi:molecular chaperone DnaJ